MEKSGRTRHVTDGSIIRRMRFARWITRATDTHFDIAFPRQQWLRHRTPVLRYMHIACVVCLESNVDIVQFTCFLCGKYLTYRTLERVFMLCMCEVFRPKRDEAEHSEIQMLRK